MGDVVLSAGVRQNLLSLQNTARLMSITQNRLATGRKVNTALDNPINYFTASALQSRASDLSALLDAMSNGIKTLEAADNGIKAIKNTIESMQSTLRQARQDKSFKTSSHTLDTVAIGTTTAKNVSFVGGSVGAAPVNVALNTATVSATLTGSQAVPGIYTGGNFTIQAANLNGGVAVTTVIANDTSAANVVIAINAALDAAPGGDGGITATQVGGVITLTGVTGNNITVNGTASVLTAFGFTAAQVSANGVVGAVKSVDQIVTAINTSLSLAGKIRASNDNGKLRIENLSTADLTETGVTANGDIDGGIGTAVIGGNDVRRNLVNQYNELRDQLDKLSDDSSFNGVNLLRGDKLTLTFNENGTSSIVIQAKDLNNDPTAINAFSLNIASLTNPDLDSDTSIDSRLDELTKSLSTLRSQASNFGSNLFIVQNRTEFTKSMITTLQTGGDTLVLADINEEGANMLALQTRQQLSTTALALSSQADQAVLRLFG